MVQTQAGCSSNAAVCWDAQVEQFPNTLSKTCWASFDTEERREEGTLWTQQLVRNLGEQDQGGFGFPCVSHVPLLGCNL
jgi:hypothetical protein